MNCPLNILIVEDDPLDAELIVERLRADGIDVEWRRVDSEKEFAECLEQNPQVVLSDFSLPAFDGMKALRMTRERDPDVPFIIVSGTIGEDRAVAAMQNGASDYIIKDRMGRLVPALKQALERSRMAMLQRQAEEAMRESEFKYRHLFEGLSDAAFLAEVASGRVLDVNPSAERLLGVDRKSLMGKMFETIHAPKEYGRVSEAMAGWITGEPAGAFSVESEVVRADGAMVPVSISAGTLTLYGRRLILALYRDISDRRRMEAQFLRAQRLESIGMMASGIAHDLNNILAPILMSATLLRDGVSAEERDRFLESIEKCARRGADIIRQMLAFARGSEGKRVALQPRHLIKEIVGLTRETFPKSIAIRTSVSKDLWEVHGDATLLHQVLLNLCVNARDAISESGEIRLSGRNATLSSEQIPATSEAKPGQYVILEVKDSGAGIDSDLMERIFDPFFTTKDPGKGTGLGLPCVQEITKSHGGFVSVTSESGQGTSFEVCLPADHKGGSPAENTKESGAPRGQEEMILIVDDEVNLAVAITHTLCHYGYRAVSARDGTEAIAVLARHVGEVKVVVTDVMMPNLDGVDLVRAIQRFEPGLEIIATSGLTEQGGGINREEEFRELGVRYFLLKPFTADLLLGTINTVLREKRNRDEPKID